MQIALENNLNMKRGRLSLENAEINVSQSRASVLPTANVSAGFNNNWGRSIDPTTNDFIAQRITSTGFSGNTGMTLFNGLRQYNTIRQSNMNLNAAEMDLEAAQNDLVLNVASAYLNVIQNRELVQNAQYQIQSTQEQLDRTEKLVASGALPITNELELRSQVASDELNLINQETALEFAYLSLKQIMLIPSDEELDIVVPNVDAIIGDLPTLSSDGFYQVALGNQPQIKSADLGVQSANLGVQISSGARYPTLGVGGGFSTNYSTAFQQFQTTGTQTQQVGFTSGGDDVFVINPTGELIDVDFGDQIDQNLSYFLGIQLNIPIFNGLITESDIQRSKINLQQAEITSIEQRNLLRQDIENAYTNAVTSQKAYEASVRRVEAVEETFRAVENQYNLGAVNFTDYQVASNNLFGARTDLVRNKYSYAFSLKILEFYQGNQITFD